MAPAFGCREAHGFGKGGGFQNRFRLAEGNAGNDGAQVHVDDVVVRHQALDLAEGEPDEIGVFGDFRVDFDEDVPVALVEKPRALFGLQLVQKDAGAGTVEEPLQKPRALALMDAGIVAFRGLEGGRKLDAVDVARLDLGLDEEMEDAVEFAGDAAEKADFGLVDDGLGPFGLAAPVGFNPDAIDGEKFPGRMADAPGRFLQRPMGHPGQPGGGNAHDHFPIAPGQPFQHLFRGDFSSLFVHRGLQEALFFGSRHRRPINR